MADEKKYIGSARLTEVLESIKERFAGVAYSEKVLEVNIDAPTYTAPFNFGIDDDGNCGYIKPGETTVTPFGSGGTSIAGRTTVFDSETISLSNLEVE